ncbi:D-aspartate oxidase [Panulirus ornatus]|uniref:D-aspartate oxidase n=1 Tax=Panulirus ornatus TaxID=150431 RepID=UPI003A869C12
MASVCVVGAGVVGLTTATLLQEALPDTASVTLIADKFKKDTTSDGAAGIFRPGLQFQGSSAQVTRQWLRDSYGYFHDISTSEEASTAGVKPISGFILSSKNPSITRNPLLEPLVPEYRMCTDQELQLFDYKYGCYFTTLMTECRRFLPYLTDQFSSRGGRVIERHLESLEQLAGHFDVVCNCTGYGARDLCADLSVTPIRGQVFKVRAPWIKNFMYEDYDTYIVPGFDYVTLGGTRQFDSHSLEIDKYDSMAIWDRCVRLVPSLKDAEVIQEWVGWRPYRPVVRVEKEVMAFDSGKTLKVVHNYGHGGYGVMASPGTSMHAVRLVQEMLDVPRAKL